MRIIGIALCVTILFSSCSQQEKTDKYDHLDSRTKIRLQQYLAAGKQLYNLHCANCHQMDGSGLAKLYPPLKGADYLITNRNASICGMRHGHKGGVVVNGITYEQEMPANLKLTDLDIAEIATYVYTEFADTVQIVTINEVNSIMASCSDDLSK